MGRDHSIECASCKVQYGGFGDFPCDCAMLPRMTPHDFDNFVMPVISEALGFTPELIDFGGDWLDLQVSDVTFDILVKLSELLGTRVINVRTERHQIGCGDGTCDFSYDVGLIRIDEIATWPDARRTA